jgi:hypothetical protein
MPDVGSAQQRTGLKARSTLGSVNSSDATAACPPPIKEERSNGSFTPAPSSLNPKTPQHYQVKKSKKPVTEEQIGPVAFDTGLSREEGLSTRKGWAG